MVKNGYFWPIRGLNLTDLAQTSYLGPRQPSGLFIFKSLLVTLEQEPLLLVRL